MRPPSPLLILFYITLSRSVKVVSKRGSARGPLFWDFRIDRISGQRIGSIKPLPPESFTQISIAVESILPPRLGVIGDGVSAAVWVFNGPLKGSRVRLRWYEAC
uniref:Secreted protein n=1 Tax=Knipowitschia caucasica TaxID=637954 RepID=A0AAV2K2S1_KNICA